MFTVEDLLKTIKDSSIEDITICYATNGRLMFEGTVKELIDIDKLHKYYVYYLGANKAHHLYIEVHENKDFGD